MRPRPAAAFLLLPALLAVTFLAACATPEKVPSHGRVEMPDTFQVALDLEPGHSWTSRFVSTNEMTRTFKGADGKESAKTRVAGLELVATQTIESVAGEKATIAVRETSARILQEGKYIEAPFKRFEPPNPVRFTLDTKTGKTDFSAMEKAYADWMASVREGPAGEIVGKSFRLDAYVTQLKELYGKPFVRFAGKALPRGARGAVEKDFVQPFLGPGVSLGPVPVEMRAGYEGMEVKGRAHALKVEGRYEGKVGLTPEELRDRLADFNLPAPSAYESAVTVTGKVRSAVDVLTGRETRSESEFDYRAEASFDGGAFTETIKGRATLDPAE